MTCRHVDIPGYCADLGLPSPPDEGSKRERLTPVIESITESNSRQITERYLEVCSINAENRIEIEELLWQGTYPVVFLKRYRREIARAIDTQPLYTDADRFDHLLQSLFIVSGSLDMQFLGLGKHIGLRDEIQQHVHLNDDWTAEYLLDRLGALDCTDKRFALLLEGLSSASVKPDETRQRRFVDALSAPLASCGAAFRETDEHDGYPVFSIVSTHDGIHVPPKNLIFASQIKPDIRFADAIHNDIEIVTNADKVLVYDRPIGHDGLRWRDLQEWWSESLPTKDDVTARTTLYKRLVSALPESSPPQRALFRLFFKIYGNAARELPALLPEVWLHWDPKTVNERGADALLRFRMDFLMLFPHGVRVVIEVDGKLHYTKPDDKCDPDKYAKMAFADRDLKLAGYEVFRFGATELMKSDTEDVVKEFFDRLFSRYGMQVAVKSEPKRK